MATYRVKVESKTIDWYVVEADSESEAYERWGHGIFDFSEAYDSEAVDAWVEED